MLLAPAALVAPAEVNTPAVVPLLAARKAMLPLRNVTFWQPLVPVGPTRLRPRSIRSVPEVPFSVRPKPSNTIKSEPLRVMRASEKPTPFCPVMVVAAPAAFWKIMRLLPLVPVAFSVSGFSLKFCPALTVKVTSPAPQMPLAFSAANASLKV